MALKMKAGMKQGTCKGACTCCGAQAARVSRKAVAVRASYHSNWRTQSVAVVQNNGSSNGASSLVPKQMAQAARPLPAQPIARPTPGDLNNRYASVLKHFPSALGVDDFIARVEVALCYFAVTNLQDETVWGGSFNVNGLGGVITCGVTGFKAGLSHAPVCAGTGRERYVFFSFPHIGIDEVGDVGAISRPGRAKKSCACGALAKCLNEVKADGLGRNFAIPGRPCCCLLVGLLACLGRFSANMGLVDLEKLISKAVDTSKADYAVVTGVQIHNWARNLDDPNSYSMEFVAPSTVYAVVNGVATHLDLSQIPQVTPRMLNLLASSSMGQAPAAARITTQPRATPAAPAAPCSRFHPATCSSGWCQSPGPAS
ncbi:GON30 protein [Scenedesmus sp. NREL 46B-D3]|nr:GON30 protein [Scenedesmus sp. NREL 46B-D3]